MLTDREWDRKLHIFTGGREDYWEDEDCYAYEPTDYCILERLAQSGYIGRTDHLVDYGSGKGRVSFFLNATTGCRVTGIEKEDSLLEDAEKNLVQYRMSRYGRDADIRFLNRDARTFRVTDENRFFFFNPFSDKILRVVLDRIIDAWYENPRQLYLFFYYPEDEYVARLLMTPELAFVDEIDCTDLYEHPSRRERILVFEMEDGETAGPE